ncbi:MAG: hypothetical protein ACRDG3_08805 [Tepidiformaceae bacterium]
MARKSMHQLIPHHHNPVPRLKTNWPANAGEPAEAEPEAVSAETLMAAAGTTIAGIPFAFLCAECGEHYHLTLGQIILSQADLAGGCDLRDDDECQSAHFASLADRADIEELVRAWAKVEAAVTARGGHVEPRGGVAEGS